jgi:hypothetical protein
MQSVRSFHQHSSTLLLSNGIEGGGWVYHGRFEHGSQRAVFIYEGQ